MRFNGETAKQAVQKEMKSVAARLAEKAAHLQAFAEGFDEVDDDDFMLHLGDQHAGPSVFIQWSKEVTEACTMRPSETIGFERAMAEAMAESQRFVAVEKEKS